MMPLRSEHFMLTSQLVNMQTCRHQRLCTRYRTVSNIVIDFDMFSSCN